MKKIKYSASGVDYSLVDPFKILMQRQGKATSGNLKSAGFKEVVESRGETAYVVNAGDFYLAFVQEGLGSKNLIADQMHKLTGKTYYSEIAQDAIASIVNDLIPVGAKPFVVNAYWATYSYEWFKDKKRAEALISGWRKACDMAGVVWGGGETQSLPDTIKKGVIELAGSGAGIISPKERLTLGEKLAPGDAIILVGSSGVHANGLSLARKISKRLRKGYATLLPDGNTYGESLLTPTHIYARLVNDLFETDVDIHCMVNITGHGWRKLMRANKDLTYILERVPAPQPIFKFIQENSGSSDHDMYSNFNMGAGLAIFVPEKDASRTLEIIGKNKFIGLSAGYVEKGPKQVIIKPKDIVFKGETLGVR